MANIIVNLAKGISYLGRVIKSRYIFSKGLTKIHTSQKLEKRFLLNFSIGCKTILCQSKRLHKVINFLWENFYIEGRFPFCSHMKQNKREVSFCPYVLFFSNSSYMSRRFLHNILFWIPLTNNLLFFFYFCQINYKIMMSKRILSFHF